MLMRHQLARIIQGLANQSTKMGVLHAIPARREKVAPQKRLLIGFQPRCRAIRISHSQTRQGSPETPSILQQHHCQYRRLGLGGLLYELRKLAAHDCYCLTT